MMKRKKLCLNLFMVVLLMMMNGHFCMNLHRLLSGVTVKPQWYGLSQILDSMVQSPQHLYLFSCFTALGLLIIVYFNVLNHRPYESNLDEITPMIRTPVKAGQYQFGSARWLSDKEKKNVFSQVELEKYKFCLKDIFLYFIKKGRINDEKKVILSSTKSKENKKDVHTQQAGYKESQENQKVSSGGLVIGMSKKRNREYVYYIGEDTHSLCIGATRSGKTRCIVLQSIGLLGLSGESMLISDPKSELYHYTMPYLESKGYEVLTLDFRNPLKSNGYNFLQPVIDAIEDENIPKAIEATWDLTAALVPEDSHSEKIWSNGEASIIAAAIMSVVYDNRHNKEGGNRKYQNMSNVYFFISEMCKVVGRKMPLESYLKTIPSNHPARGLLAISEIAPSKTKGSFFTSALTNLRLFTNPLIWSMTSHSEIRPEELGQKKVALFVMLPDEKKTYYSLASLFVNQCYMALVNQADKEGGRLKNRVNMLLDEFGNFSKIPDFSNKLTVGGGRGIRFNLFLQSFAQLDEVYNKENAQTIKGNCETWIYLQTDDLSTLEELSKKLGNYTVSTYSLSSSHGKYTMPSTSHSTNLTHRALLTVDEVRLINRPYILVTSRHHPAIMMAPDLSKWSFNQTFGLGDKTHNIKIREIRESHRNARELSNDIDLWNIWEFHKGKMAYSKFNQEEMSFNSMDSMQEIQKKGGFRYEETEN